MISKRLLTAALAALTALPLAVTTASAAPGDQRRPAHIDRLAWRNSTSEVVHSRSGRPSNRSRAIARAWHPKNSFFRLRSLRCPFARD